ncbi:MAG: hybrid sensor histidine kinase/response regulator [Archangium sp.]|nr:hybrid sensor histidine kinase/response regulator [Archangium sp.]
MATGDVLVVDDSPQYLEILSTYLASRGHSVRVAADGEEALSLANTRRPDLVLLDVHLPGLDGFEVCRLLHEQWPGEQLPVVFLSATRALPDRMKGFHSGGVDFVAKSVHIEEVAARVETHLELKRRTVALEAANEQLRSVEESRRRFITSMVHDIKNPLTPVLKNTEWLLSQPLGDEETVEVVRDTHVAANHLHRMVLSLLDLARSAELRLEPQLQRVFVRAWLEDTLTLTRLQLRSSPGRLRVRSGDGAADFDPALMARVLQNTIDNALKYSPRNEPVDVELSVVDGGLRLVVEDRGRGVKPEDRERIFAAWTRVDEQDAQARASHGIGLAFCRQAVEAHGGQMTVEDAQPRGARFIIVLPPRLER